jgi:hypothetical protein
MADRVTQVVAEVLQAGDIPNARVTQFVAESLSLVRALAPVPPLTLTALDLCAMQGMPYSSMLVAAGGVSPYTFNVTGPLPPGLNLAGPVVSGVATTSGNYPYTASVTDSASTTIQIAGEINVLSNSPSGYTTNLLQPVKISDDQVVVACPQGIANPGWTTAYNAKATYLQIDQEWMEVNILYQHGSVYVPVIRGTEGTAVVPHALGATVTITHQTPPSPFALTN